SRELEHLLLYPTTDLEATMDWPRSNPTLPVLRSASRLWQSIIYPTGPPRCGSRDRLHQLRRFFLCFDLRCSCLPSPCMRRTPTTLLSPTETWSTVPAA